ncbi:hypothetical protein R6Q59_034874 [Mikania micrantha]
MAGQQRERSIENKRGMIVKLSAVMEECDRCRPSGPGDFLVHHAIALGLHTTTLILVKGALDARGSKLMPDKKDFGYSFPCDGPGRGGTCDISAWDAFYLAELIETLAWAHERTPLANLIRWRDKPVALSIVQARLVGLAHFSVGYIFTYAAFLIASTSGKFG